MEAKDSIKFKEKIILQGYFATVHEGTYPKVKNKAGDDQQTIAVFAKASSHKKKNLKKHIKSVNKKYEEKVLENLQNTVI